MTGMLAVVSEMGYTAAKKRGERIAERPSSAASRTASPYGYRRNGGYDGSARRSTRPRRKALVPDEHTAPIVRRIYKLRAAGESWTGIADMLNAAGVPCPSGRRWIVPTLCSIVANEAYLGIVVLGDRRETDAHEPLVTRAQCERAQSTETVTRNGRMVAGLAGAVLVCSGVRQADARVRGEQRLGNSTCSTGAPRVRGRPVPAPDQREEERRRRVRRPGGGRRDRRRRSSSCSPPLASLRPPATAVPRRPPPQGVGQARRPRSSPTTSRTRSTTSASASSSSAADAYERPARHAADVDDLPTTADAWHALDVAHQRLVARSLIDAVVVAPPTSRSRYADITERFTVRWKSGS